MSAGTKYLIIDQGSDWKISINYTDSEGATDLTGYSANMQLRTSYDAASPALSLSTGYLDVISLTSDTISVGSSTFLVNATSAFTVGARVRAAESGTPENFQEGLVTAIVPNTSVTINVDLTGGSGTISHWVFSSAAPGITTGLSDGTKNIFIHAKAAETEEIVPGDYVYDIELTAPNGEITRILQGRATVTPQVTR